MKATFVVAMALAGPLVRAELHIELTEERIQRGEYMTLTVIGCQGCHSERAIDRYGFPPREDRVLAGGVIFRDIGERAITPNLTPYALGDWTDQQIFDAITRGVRPDGRVLAKEMPYERYGTMDPEVIYDVIAYLRSIEPVEAGPYPAEFPGEHVAFEPRFGELVEPPPSASTEERGAYLVNAAGCDGCHVGTGDGLDGAKLAGGRVFDLTGRGAHSGGKPHAGRGDGSRGLDAGSVAGALQGDARCGADQGGAGAAQHGDALVAIQLHE